MKGVERFDPRKGAKLTEVSGIASPDDSPNGEIVITSVPEPTALVLLAFGSGAIVMYRHVRSTGKVSPKSSPNEHGKSSKMAMVEQ